MKNIRRSGFTLIELVIYIGLLGILIVVMSQVFVAIMRVKLESQSTSVIQEDGSYMRARISYDVHRANAIVSPPLGQSSSVLSLDIVENGSHKTYTYTASSSGLTLSDGAYTDTLVSSGSSVTRFTVTRVGNSDTASDAKDTVDILLTLTSRYQVSGTPDQLEYRFAAGLR